MTIRVGCFGAGGVAQRHLETAQQLEEVAIVGIAGGSRASALAADYGAKVFKSVEHLCESGIDALLICTPPAGHQNAELIAVESRIPFFVEKPLATTLSDAEEIAAAVEAADITTAVGYQWRYHASVDAAKRWLETRHVSLVEGWWLTTTPGVPWWEQRQKSGGQVVEQLTHIVDAARWLVGEAEVVAAVGQHVDRTDHPNSDIEEVSSLLVRFETAAIGSFTSSCLLPRPGFDVGLRLVGDGFSIRINANDATLESIDGKEHANDDGLTFRRLLDAFFDAIRDGNRSNIRSDYADAMRTHRLTTRAAMLIEQ